MIDYLEQYQLRKGVREYFLMPKMMKKGQQPLYAGDENLVNYCLSLVQQSDIVGQSGIENEKCMIILFLSEEQCVNIIEQAVANRDNELVIEGEVVEDDL